jgi:hypothetical protein
VSEYARRNLVCSSWIKLPEGWHAWQGMSGGYSVRPWCSNVVGHVGDHSVYAEHQTETEEVETTVDYSIVEPESPNPIRKEMQSRPVSKQFTWANTLGLPDWLLDTTIHGLAMLADRKPGLKPGAIGDVIDALEAQRKEATHG